MSWFSTVILPLIEEQVEKATPEVLEYFLGLLKVSHDHIAKKLKDEQGVDTQSILEDSSNGD